MRTLAGLTLACLGLCPRLLPAQNEILYYKFDEAGGGRVTNFAPAASPAPEEGTVTSTDVSGFAPGRMGPGALRGGGPGGSSFIETGWNGSFSGDFSAAFFMRQRNPGTALMYFFGNNVGGGFRAFTNGVGGRGMILRNWGGTPADLATSRDLQALAAAGWVHVAIVVDTSRGVATWYVDGVPEPAIPIGSGANVPASPGFRAGAQLSATYYDIDEFRFLNRAASPVEVRAWSQQTTAADSPFGRGCGATLAASSGPPRLGNALYQLDLAGALARPYLLGIGTSRTTWFGVPLPFDLGAVFGALPGCQWEASLTLVFPGVLDVFGNATVGLPIPNDAALDGASIYGQGFIIVFAAEQTSNPIAIAMGR
jgi:hypothetical protein